MLFQYIAVVKGLREQSIKTKLKSSKVSKILQKYSTHSIHVIFVLNLIL